MFEAKRFSASLALAFSAVRTGTKAAERAVSANRSRSRLGMRKATLYASTAKPAPNRWATTISRTRPMTRLKAVPMVKDRTPREMSSMLRPLFDIFARPGKAYRTAPGPYFENSAARVQ